RVHHLDPRVAERVRHHLRTAVVPVQTRLRDQDLERSVAHGETGVKAARYRGRPSGSSPTRRGESRTRAPILSAPGSETPTSGANTRCAWTSIIAKTSGFWKPAGTPVSRTLKPRIWPSAGRSTQSNSSDGHAGQKPRGGQRARPHVRHRVVVRRPSARCV